MKQNQRHHGDESVLLSPADIFLLNPKTARQAIEARASCPDYTHPVQRAVEKAERERAKAPRAKQGALTAEGREERRLARIVMSRIRQRTATIPADQEPGPLEASLRLDHIVYNLGHGVTRLDIPVGRRGRDGSETHLQPRAPPDPAGNHATRHRGLPPRTAPSLTTFAPTLPYHARLRACDGPAANYYYFAAWEEGEITDAHIAAFPFRPERVDARGHNLSSSDAIVVRWRVNSALLTRLQHALGIPRANHVDPRLAATGQTEQELRQKASTRRAREERLAADAEQRSREVRALKAPRPKPQPPTFAQQRAIVPTPGQSVPAHKQPAVAATEQRQVSVAELGDEALCRAFNLPTLEKFSTDRMSAENTADTPQQRTALKKEYRQMLSDARAHGGTVTAAVRRSPRPTALDPTRVYTLEEQGTQRLVLTSRPSLKESARLRREANRASSTTEPPENVAAAVPVPTVAPAAVDLFPGL